MSIKDFKQKIKLFWANTRDTFYSREKGIKIKSDLFVVFLIVLVSFASFGLGKLSAYENQKTPILEYYDDVLGTTSTRTLQKDTVPASINERGIVFSSKTGTRYYYPSCLSGNRITETNRIWFQSVSDAEAKGLTLANGCKQ